MLCFRWATTCIVLTLAGCGGSPPSSTGDAGVLAADASPDAGTDGGSVIEQHDVLFVGNSYLFVNDVPGHYTAIARELFGRVRVEEVSAGGYTLAQHAADAASADAPLARWLRTGTAEETAFDAIVLQEQSQIGGFPLTEADRRISVAAARELAALATARGARVFLYLTWGREHGDPSLSLIGFGTYEGMQDALDEGYLGLAALLREQGADVEVAPVGGGFRLVYEDVMAAGEDPHADGSDFDALYEPDGSHPSARGAYLAACIMAGRITGADVLGFRDEPALGAEVSTRLRDVCARALMDPRWHVPRIVRSEGVLEGDGDEGGSFGASVASSADGQRLLVGGPRIYPTTSPGLARVFVRVGDTWAREADWRGALRFANSVAMSGDGLRALVGPPTVVWSRGDEWSEDAELTAEPRATPKTPTALAISGDGRRVIVSASETAIIARVFVHEGGAWVEEAALEGPATSSVAIDAEGRRAMVGGSAASSPRVFVRTDSGWIEEATLSVSAGTRVAITPDGSRAIVGAPSESRAYVFARSDGSWTEMASLRGPRHAFFGSSVALGADGTRALIGAPLDSMVDVGAAIGTVRVYSLSDAPTYELLLVPRIPYGGTAAPQFGASVAIDADAARVIVGAPHTDRSNGALYVGAAHTFRLP